MTFERFGSTGVGVAAGGCAGGMVDMGVGRGSSRFVGEKPKGERCVNDGNGDGDGAEELKVEKPCDGLGKELLVKPGRCGEGGRSSIAGFRSGWCSG